MTSAFEGRLKNPKVSSRSLWVGGNNLSKWIVAASRPQQRVLLVGRKYGVATDERIYLDGDRSKRRRPKVYKAAR